MCFQLNKKTKVVKVIWNNGSWTHIHSIPAKSLHKVHKVRFRWYLLFQAPVIADCQFEDNFCGWKSFSPEGEGGWKWSSGNLNPKGKTHWWLVRVVGDYFSGAARQFRRSRLCPLLFVLSRPFIFYILETDSTPFFTRVTAQVLSLYDSLHNWNREILIVAYSFTIFCNQVYSLTWTNHVKFGWRPMCCNGYLRMKNLGFASSSNYFYRASLAHLIWQCFWSLTSPRKLLYGSWAVTMATDGVFHKCRGHRGGARR